MSTSNSDSMISTPVYFAPPVQEWAVPVYPSPPSYAPLPETMISYCT